MDPRFTPRQEDLDGIHRTYDTYRGALLEQRGSDAASVVTTETLLRYEFYRIAALHAPSDFLQHLGGIDVLSILRMRHSISAETLLTMSGADLFTHGVDSGWVGKESVANNLLGDIVIFQDWAEAECITRGQKNMMRFRFVREATLWKLDLLYTLSQTGPAVETVLKSSGTSRNEALIELLSRTVHEGVSGKLWEPLFDR